MTAHDEYYAALNTWKTFGGPRPELRPDGVPTRIDLQWMSVAERSILTAMSEVERTGASTALTDAVVLLAKARDLVADHIEVVGVQS